MPFGSLSSLPFYGETSRALVRIAAGPDCDGLWEVASEKSVSGYCQFALGLCARSVAGRGVLLRLVLARGGEPKAAAKSAYKAKGDRRCGKNHINDRPSQGISQLTDMTLFLLFPWKCASAKSLILIRLEIDPMSTGFEHHIRRGEKEGVMPPVFTAVSIRVH